ncbi:ECF sigma factor [Sulfidibacter corallicola]|uniref:RNA polymerase sigma-70 ECF-like HTH domain-containing protein n=1 Tax=Sulfidibacter corallicola TaxID=2818388 RepID=A0A8A4TQN9_SULCO|nr:ECF-type sigma factor [Sulfidibacter corallicola]QTD48855.1 hypothetical protein J3U87_25005 [Sulfidibacter corallicola]
MSPTDESVASALRRWMQGEPHGLDVLFEVKHAQLTRVAAGILADDYRDLDMETDELVNQSYLLMRAKPPFPMESPTHFVHVVRQVMEWHLTDLIRRRKATKNWGGLIPTDLEESHVIDDRCPNTPLIVTGVMAEIRRENPDMDKVLQLRGIPQFTIAETASALDMPVIRVNRLWRAGRDRFHRLLDEGSPN